MITEWQVGLTGLHAIATGKNAQVQTTGEGVENLIHVGQHEVILLHVELGHVLRQTGGGGLLPREIVGRLLTIAKGQGGVEVEIGCFLRHLHQLGNRNFAQYFACPMGFTHVTGKQAGIGLADFG